MSAQLAGHGVPTNYFTAHLALAAGVTVSINAPSMHALRNVVAVLQPAEAANDVGNAPTPAAATAPAGQPASTTTAPSAQPAAAAAAGDAGNKDAGAQPAASSAQAASSEKPAASPASSLPADPKEAFEVLKKAFLGLSTKPGGREKCEKVLASVEPKPAKLSAATPEQYPALMAAIQKASE